MFFVETTSAGPELQISADLNAMNINTTAGIGFLELDVTGGSLFLDLDVSLDLLDPGATGRITGDVLATFTGNIEDYADVQFSGFATLSLPLSSTLVPTAGTQTLNHHSNDPTSMTVNVITANISARVWAGLR